MDLKRCENNHYYDASRYDSCPHCKQGAGQEVTVAFDQGIPGQAAGANQEPYTVPQDHPGAGPSYGFGSGGVPIAPTVRDSSISGGGSLQESLTQTQGAAGYEEDSKTVGIYTLGKEPVVGWLVCIEGNYLGESFQLKTGRNFIGRARTMDVVLATDNSVSRERHAIILYEPKRREFIAQAGESRELFYLNDDVVLNAQRMQAYDVLTVGKTKLMFFPCCGERFGWDDYIKEEDEN